MSWEVASRPPVPPLRGVVRRMQGYVERTAGPLQRDEFSGPEVVVIFELGPPLRVFEHLDRPPSTFRGGFVAGLSDRFTRTAHDGFQAGVQLDLTVLGAHRVFGFPMSELAHRVLPLDAVLDPEDRGLLTAMGEAPGWDERFDRLERWLLHRLARSRVDLGPFAGAVQAVIGASEAERVGDLAAAVGCSHKHLIHRFRQHTGLTPRELRRVVRFDRLVAALRSGEARPWSRLALELGFADQAHLAREVRAFAGLTPTDLARRYRR